MKKRGIVLLIIALLTISSAYALTQENLYSGWVSDGKSVSKAGQKFSIMFQKSQYKTIITQASGQGITLNNGTCQQTDDLVFCVKNFHYYKKGVQIPLDNWTNRPEDVGDIDDVKMLVNISAIIADINITRAVDKSDLLVGEKTHVKTAIKNTGDKPAADIEFQDKFPSSVIIWKPDGCAIEGNDAVWKGILYPGQSTSCQFDLIINKATTFASEASVKYFNNLESTAKKSSKTTFKAQLPLIFLDTKIKKKSLIIGNSTNLTFSVKNGYQQEMPIASVTVLIPKGVSVRKADPKLQKVDGMYQWRGMIAKNTTEIFNIAFLAEKTGHHVFNITEELTVNDTDFLFLETESIDVASDLVILVEFPDLKTNIRQGESTTVKASLRNPTLKTIKNIYVRFDTNLPLVTKEMRIDELGKNEGKELIEMTLNPMENIYLNMSGTYESIYGEKFPISEHANVKVYKASEPIPAATTTTTTTTSTMAMTKRIEKAGKNYLIILGSIVVVIIVGALLIFWKKGGLRSASQ